MKKEPVIHEIIKEVEFSVEKLFIQEINRNSNWKKITKNSSSDSVDEFDINSPERKKNSLLSLLYNVKYFLLMIEIKLDFVSELMSITRHIII